MSGPTRFVDGFLDGSLAPVWEGHTPPRLLGLSSGQFWDYGRIVFVGQDITENDIFVKLVDSGRKIPNVDQT